MKAEIIAVGTELLLGQIANTNAQYLSQRLAQVGIGVYLHTAVGDNPERLAAVIKQAQERSDLILFTGGLGPTQDDLTKETVAQVLGRELDINSEAEEKIRKFFAQRNLTMAPNNIKQAQVLKGSTVFPNETGLAVGMGIKHENKIYILLPGPPSEMKPMFDQYVVPYLHTLIDTPGMLYSKVLRFFGIGESSLVTELADLIEQQTDPTIAPYAKDAEVTLRVTTRASSPEKGEVKLAPVLNEIRRRVGQHIYGEGDDSSLEGILLSVLKEKKESVAFAESCTGGLVSQLITAIPGASESFKGSIVCYSNLAKERLVGVDPYQLAANGAVSPEVAMQLAKNVREGLESDWGVSITGVAGPEPSEGKPVGLVYIGISSKEDTTALEFRFAGPRHLIQLRAAKTALFQLWKRLKKGE